MKTVFVQLEAQTHYPGAPLATVRWRVVGVDKEWCLVQLPTVDDCFRALRWYAHSAVGADARVVTVEVNSGGEERLHHLTRQAYRAALSEEALSR